MVTWITEQHVLKKYYQAANLIQFQQELWVKFGRRKVLH
jgi:hypothetical protein